MKKSTYEIITDQILKALEDGTVPWNKPWNATGYKHNHPTNLVSKKGYRGINYFLLAFAPFNSPYWLTFNQCRKLKGKVKKGSHGTPIVFWKMIDTKEINDKTGLPNKIPFMRYYTVFNSEQCEDLDISKLENPADFEDLDFNPIEECETIVDGMPKKPVIEHGGSRAFYRQSADLVGMPEQKDFKSVPEYYGTLFHELAHSTKHEKRLDRNGKGFLDFGDVDAYSKEELVAEMTAAFLCAIAGIDNKTIENSAAYIKSWSSKLKEDKKMVVEAAQKAQKAADYILKIKFDNKDKK